LEGAHGEMVDVGAYRGEGFVQLRVHYLAIEELSC
jgi:hypothetical protein